MTNCDVTSHCFAAAVDAVCLNFSIHVYAPIPYVSLHFEVHNIDKQLFSRVRVQNMSQYADI